MIQNTHRVLGEKHMALTDNDKLWFEGVLKEHFVSKEECQGNRAECYKQDIAPLKTAQAVANTKIAVIAAVVGSVAGSWDKVLGLFK